MTDSKKVQLPVIEASSLSAKDGKRNFVHPRASSKDSPIRCSHLIGNVQHQDTDDDGTLRISSNFSTRT